MLIAFGGVQNKNGHPPLKAKKPSKLGNLNLNHLLKASSCFSFEKASKINIIAQKKQRFHYTITHTQMWLESWTTTYSLKTADDRQLV